MATLQQSELAIAEERITAQWLAGFFDGEGCITVSLSGVKNPRLMVTLTQSDFDILDIIRLKFFTAGGTLYSPVRKFSKREKRPIYLISVTGKCALPFLRAIAPYVVLKRKLVEWAIEMGTLTGERGKCGRGNSLPIQVVERRHELMRLVRTENSSQKGDELAS